MGHLVEHAIQQKQLQLQKSVPLYFSNDSHGHAYHIIDLENQPKPELKLRMSVDMLSVEPGKEDNTNGCAEDLQPSIQIV
jgi:hypothetical protein